MASPELQRLRQQRERYVTRLFIFMLEVIAVFGIPAVGAVLLGKHLGGGGWLVGLLVVAFVLSWTITIVRYKQITKRVQDIENQIAKLSAKEGIVIDRAVPDDDTKDEDDY